MKRTLVKVIAQGDHAELVVTVDAYIDMGYYAEYGNPSTYVYPTCEYTLKSVELLIGREFIDITKSLTKEQKDFITQNIEP